MSLHKTSTPTLFTKTGDRLKRPIWLCIFWQFLYYLGGESIQFNQATKGVEFYLATKLFPGYPVAAPSTRKSEPEPGNPESSPHLADVTYRSEQSLPPKATDVWKEKNDKTGFKPVFLHRFNYCWTRGNRKNFSGKGANLVVVFPEGAKKTKKEPKIFQMGPKTISKTLKHPLCSFMKIHQTHIRNW